MQLQTLKIVFACALARLVLCGVESYYQEIDKLFTSLKGNYVNDYYRENGIETTFNRTSVQFFCVQPGSQRFVKVFSSDSRLKLAEKFDLSLRWGFVVHGWMDNFNSTYVTVNGRGWVQGTVIDWAYYSKSNVCGVDWSYLAISPNYLKVALVNTHIAAERIAYFILNLVQAGIPTENISIAGHSLGAHVAGFVGKLIIGNGLLINTIWGLDPAGPLFTYPLALLKNRLTNTDAAFVEVLHTSAHTFGAQVCLGDADFWANGGKLQPNCSTERLNGVEALVDDVFLCSHYRAVEYFWYTLNPSNKLIGNYCDKRCADIVAKQNYATSGACSSSRTNRFGIFTQRAAGFYNLQTAAPA